MSTSTGTEPITTTAPCCAGKPAAAASDAHAHAHAHTPAASTVSLNRLASSATLHCLTGCSIGELIGLAIGLMLGLDPWSRMLLGTVMGFVSGFSLGLRPLLQQGMSLRSALQAIWLGEVISISVMELAMNFTDYHVGGVMAPSIVSPIFWAGYASALLAGFIAAWPVNRWMLASSIKKPCH